MKKLKEMECEACRVGAPLVTDQELRDFLPQIPEWNVDEIDGVSCLRRVFSFQDFQQALTFTNKIGEIAEEMNHHPAILTEWGKVTVTWWTHKIHGIHKNDLILAAKTDTLLSFG